MMVQRLWIGCRVTVVLGSVLRKIVKTQGNVILSAKINIIMFYHCKRPVLTGLV